MKQMKKVITIMAISVALQAAVPNAPRIGDVIREAQVPKELTQKKKKPLVEIKGVKPVHKPQLKNSKNFKRVFVKSFSIEGNSHIKNEKLIALLKKYKNKKLSFNDMQIVASIITSAYRKDGYIVARAYIPVQNMNDGVLQIVVIEGVYGKFKLTNNSRVKISLIQSMLDTTKSANVINNSSLERTLLLVNELPGVVVTNASIEAGKNIGSSDFLITTDSSNFYDGYLLANNYGGRYTGENQLIGGVNINSPFKIGDKLSLVGFVSNGANLKNGSVSYDFPLYNNGLRGEIGYYKTFYSLTKEFANLDAVGTAQSYYVKVNYPLIKQRQQDLEIYIKAERGTLRDEIRSTNFNSLKYVNVYRLGLDYDIKDLKLFNINQELRTSMILTYGDLKFANATQSALDKASVDTEGHYSKIALSLKYNINLTNSFTLENSLKYQHALGHKNLDGSEDFAVGGAYGAILYPTGELSAENGYLVKIEAKQILPSIFSISHSAGLFYDTGHASMENPTATFKSRTLQDVGISYYAYYKKFFLNAKIAWKIDNEEITSEPDANYKLLVMGGFSF